jgi:predicted nucleic acid-binding protein
MTVTFDSSAWIEYFAGSKIGLNVKELVDSMEIIYTPSIGLMEIKNKYQREKKQWKSRIDFISDRSLIIDIDTEIALQAADIKNKYGLYSLDAIMYSSAQQMKSKLLTKDTHFKNLKDVIMLK